MTSPTSSMTTTAVAAAGLNYIDALAAGIKWGDAGPGASIAYSFPYANGGAVWAADYSSNHEPDTASGFGSEHQAAARQALQKWADVAKLSFVETVESPTNVGDIRFAYTQSPVVAQWWGFAYYAGQWFGGGDIWVNAGRAADDWSPGSNQFSPLLHEIGHALGLKHPFGDTPVLPVAQDSQQYTLMSYTQHPHALFRDVVDQGGGAYSWTYYSVVPQTPMLYDIAAIQYLYGANTSYHSGNDTYTFNPDSPFFMTIWDAGGSDTISVANFTKGCTLDLRAGYFSKITIESDPLPLGATGTTPTYDGTDNLAIAFGVTIEKAIGGSGNDSLIGNAANNSLDGGAGADSMAGGDGNDVYYVRDAGDVVSETNANLATGGTDLVYSYLAAYTLGGNLENGRILATGVANLIGNGLNNVLYAGQGNNLLNGGAGSDTVSYQYGVTGTTGVSVSLAVVGAQATVGSGSDTLIGIEHLTGSAFADKLTGNSGANQLNGGAGNDTLNGGSGADSLYGGEGNDLYTVDNAGDRVSESNIDLASGGNDLVNSSLAVYTLTANVERLRILSTGAANGTGNSLDNTLYAGSGDNVLNGGAGSDTVSYAYGTSGTGVTVSLASSAAQVTGGSGSDTLLSIEHLIGSANADRLTGNSGANRLDGGTGNDTLAGGLGNDTLLGGTGLDSFRFDSLPNSTTNRDTIAGFNVADDVIELDNAIFTALNSGPLAAGSFHVGAGAGDADDRVIYNQTTGALYYDSDGTGANAAVQFATLSGIPALSYVDFLVV